MSKTADRLILRPDPGDSPGSASTGETPLRKMSKAVAPRDTKPDSGRELANCNLSSIQGSSEKETRRRSGLKLDNRRISLEWKSGQASSDHETFTKSHALDFHSGKTFDRSILRVKTRDSPRTVPTGERPQKKRGVGILFSRHESAL